jgi:hypothetical protein
MTHHTNADILKVVSLITGVSVAEIRSEKKNREYVTARHIYAYAVSKYGTQAKAEELINKDHTSISYGKKQIAKFLSNKREIEIRKSVESILSTLEAYVFQRPCVRFGFCKYRNGFKIPDEEIDPDRGGHTQPDNPTAIYQDS